MKNTSDDELLALHPGVALGPLQQRDPVMHLLRRVGVAVENPVGCDDHEGVGPERQGEKEAEPLSSNCGHPLFEPRLSALPWGSWATRVKMAMLIYVSR